MTERSVSFDRAAEYYDRTRTLGDEAIRAETELLVSQLRSKPRALEIGVGTGQVAMRLHAAGLSMVGMDLSAAMLRKLIAKAGGAAPFPIVAGDAATMPFRDAAFDGVVMRHVLHLIPTWRDVVKEVVRVVRPGGIVLVNHRGVLKSRARHPGKDGGVGRAAIACGWAWLGTMEGLRGRSGRARRYSS